MKDINGYSNLFAVIGNPVKHSLSPSIYNYAFKSLNINSVYLAFQLDNSAKLEGYVNAMRTLNISGGNITMPFKADIIPYLDQISPEAKIVGAVNTLMNKDGKIKGYNTDGKGLMAAIKEKNVTVSDSQIVIFGAGGAANSILYAVAYENAKKAYIIINKTSSTHAINKTIDYLKTHKPNFAVEIVCFQDTPKFNSVVSSSDILINATPLGMHPNADSTPIEDIALLKKEHVVVDIVYNPRLTRLLASAKDIGCVTINGLDMLLYQAAEAFALFTNGQTLPIANIKEIVFEENQGYYGKK